MTKNINYVSHKKSKLKTNDGKPQLPPSSTLVEGEIAINYAEDVETLSIKNESGTVVTFSSDNYYTEQKLGDDFTGNTTVTDLIDEVNISNGVTPTRDSVELWVDTSDSAIPTAFDVYTKTEVNSLLDNKSNTGHTHVISDVNNLQDNLNAKVNKAEYNTYTGSVNTQLTNINNTLGDLTKVNVLGSVQVDVRGYGESTPTLAVYAGSKENMVKDVLSHFKLGWFDGNGKLKYECAPGRISAAKDGTEIAIDGTNGDLLVYVDTDIYMDRLTTNGINVNGSTANTYNVIGLGLTPHFINGVESKKFEPFAFTPHCAKYDGQYKAYSYYDGGNVQTSINALNSSIWARNKGGGYMGLYYEFYEIWLMAMYLELGTLDATHNELFGRGCTNGTPSLSDWYNDQYEGGGGCMYTGNTFGSFWNNTVTSYNFAEMLEAQRIMDGITKAGFANQIGANKLYTYDVSGNVISVTDTDPSTWERSSGMTVDKKYFTVKSVPGCKGLSDGVMTGIVNIYVKGTDRIRKYSHPIYRGLDLFSGFFTQLEGINHVVFNNTGSNGAPSKQMIYAAQHYTDIKFPYTSATYDDYVASTASTIPILSGLTLVADNLPANSQGYAKETDYNGSLFACNTVGASLHTYECGHFWRDGHTYWANGAADSTHIHSHYVDNGYQAANASVVGCYANIDVAGRTLNADHSVSFSDVDFAGGFAHPQITV